MKYSPGMENVYYVEETNDISEELKKVLEPWPYKLEKSVDTFLDSMPTSYKSRALLIFEERVLAANFVKKALVSLKLGAILETSLFHCSTEFFQVFIYCMYKNHL